MAKKKNHKKKKNSGVNIVNNIKVGGERTGKLKELIDTLLKRKARRRRRPAQKKISDRMISNPYVEPKVIVTSDTKAVNERQAKAEKEMQEARKKQDEELEKAKKKQDDDLAKVKAKQKELKRKLTEGESKLTRIAGYIESSARPMIEEPKKKPAKPRGAIIEMDGKAVRVEKPRGRPRKIPYKIPKPVSGGPSVVVIPTPTSSPRLSSSPIPLFSSSSLEPTPTSSPRFISSLGLTTSFPSPPKSPKPPIFTPPRIFSELTKSVPPLDLQSSLSPTPLFEHGILAREYLDDKSSFASELLKHTKEMIAENNRLEEEREKRTARINDADREFANITGKRIPKSNQEEDFEYETVSEESGDESDDSYEGEKTADKKELFDIIKKAVRNKKDPLWVGIQSLLNRGNWKGITSVSVNELQQFIRKNKIKI